MGAAGLGKTAVVVASIAGAGAAVATDVINDKLNKRDEKLKLMSKL